MNLLPMQRYPVPPPLILQGLAPFWQRTQPLRQPRGLQGFKHSIALWTLVLCLITLFSPAAKAQERGPLSMRIHFLATVGGMGVGALVGVAVWMTDPGSPSNQFSDSTLLGAAWGAIVGAGVGVVILQNTAVFPYESTTKNLGGNAFELLAINPFHVDLRRISPLRREGGSKSVLDLVGQGGRLPLVPPLLQAKAPLHYGLVSAPQPRWVMAPVVMQGQPALGLRVWF